MQYRDLSGYLKETFGCKVYKLSLVGCVSCPNRDGTVGTGGCIFCSETGAGEFAEKQAATVSEQIEKAKIRVANKLKNAEKVKYIAYFQSFTNTYAPIYYLRDIFYSAIENEEVAVLSIATRPDCLSEEVIELLNELNKIKPVWVELGLQTVHEKTAQFIRRGYSLDVYDDAVSRLHAVDVTVIAHMIIGLPGETEEMIFDTARHIGETADGIKIHCLYVQEGTDLAEIYRKGEITLPNMEEYIRLLGGCIERLPEKTVIHRMTGDGDKKTLIAPLWTANKRKVLNTIYAEFMRLDITQGRRH
ncbi:MAG: TIGR01212 family radical SAM protein [Acutalibacteraceae bacterium]|nr:TIGR01212 family radical SAM protein [Acutalibacteraceae bacterium]